MYNSNERSKIANQTTLWGSLVNLLLTLFKLFAGIFGRSTAMVADAVHSMSDFATDLVVIVSLWYAKKPSDKSHDYGHGKFETLATMVIGAALLFVGIGIGWSGIENIIFFLKGGQLKTPGYIAMIAAGVSILAKELLYQWTSRIGKKIGSQAVIANAWHHRSDAFSSIGTLIGISGAILLGEKWRVLDPIAGVIVAVFILKVGFQIAFSSLNELLECSLSDEEELKVLSLINQIDGVQDPHNLKTRKIGNNIAVDIHIRVDGKMNIIEGHGIATNVEETLRKNYGQETFVSVHIEPSK